MQNANEPRGVTKMRPIRTGRKQEDEKNQREQTQIKEQNQAGGHWTVYGCKARQL